MIFVFKELTIWLIRPNIAKHSGSFGNCEVSDIDNRLHRSQRRWRSLRIWGDSLGFSKNVQHEVYIKRCIGFALMEENEGGHFMWKDSSVQFSRSVVSDSLRPRGLQQARLPCPSPSPRVCSNSCPLSRWCHPTISSSVVPFSCLQSFSASGSFPMSQLLATGGQSIRVSASASVLTMKFSGLISFRMDWLDLLAVQGTQESSPTPQFKSINSLALSLLHSPTFTSIHDHRKNHSLD